MYKFPDWADGKSSTKQSNSTPKTSTPNFSKKQEPNQSPPDKKASTSAQSQKPLSPPQKSDDLKDIDFQQIVKSPSFDGARAQMSQLYKEKQKEKEPPKQYVRTYPPSIPVVPFHAEEPYKLHFDYSPSSIEGEDLSDFDKERIALIMSIIDSGVSKYLGFSDKVLVDYDFLPINESSDPSFAKLYQGRCLSLNKELKKYGLGLWMCDNKAVLSIPVTYALSLPEKYEDQVLSYLISECGLRIDFA